MTTPKSIDEVTAEWLDKRAEELANKRFPKFVNVFGKQNPHTLTKINLRNGFREATKLRLEQAVEVYRVVSGLQHGDDCTYGEPIPFGDESEWLECDRCNCGRDALLTKLGQDIGLQQH